ncbi:serine hydrolase domain-containing protein [Kribbella catacumbae]|uniref:serine hydrolase domain-containing protein n=1 Tax=Kribbella catacumbae TaxID=460086 RepID=UPI00036C0611|nr:serine hydrolase domain-containing protein [Kribbella catacumbae]
MRTKFLIAVLILALVPMAPAAAGRGSTLQHDADAIRAVGVTGVQARTTIPAGSRTAVSGVSDLATGRPVRAEGYFRIGSTNKTLVATVVLQLVGERRMRLDDSVEKWLPGFVRGNGYDSDRITIRHLLQHTAGIYDGNFPAIDNAEQYYQRRYLTRSEEEVVKAGLRHPPDFQPGEGWAYSNTGYNMVGLVIEAVTGRAWYAEVERRIIRPLRMHHTYWPGRDPRIRAPHAKGYTRFAAGEPYTDTTELIDADASGGFISTLADLDAFQRALFGGRLLRPKQLAEMTRTVEVNGEVIEPWKGARYGLGLFSRDLSCGGTIWIPGGDQIGYRTRLGITRDGRRSAVVAMASQLYDSMEVIFAQEGASVKLIDNAICPRR